MKSSPLSSFLISLGISAVLAPTIFAGIDERLTSVNQTNTPATIRIDFRIDDLDRVKRVEGFADGASIGDGAFVKFTDESDRSEAYVFVIDTSNPARQETVTACASAVGDLIGTLDPGAEVAVYSLAAEYQEVAAFGTPRPEVLARLRNIRADGELNLSTLIYSNCSRLILKELAGVNVNRKALVLLTDGKDETGKGQPDSGSLQKAAAKELVNTANAEKVVIHTLGYAEVGRDFADFENIMYIAHGAKGQHVKADVATKRLESSFVQAFPGYLNGGGRVTFSGAGVAGKQTFFAKVFTEGGKEYQIPEPAVQVTIAPPAVPENDTPPQPQVPAPVGQAPVAENDTAETLSGSPVEIAVLANDSDPDNDPLTVDKVTPGAEGTAEANSNGTVTYTPREGFIGSDSFTYTISDGSGGVATATVSVTVEKAASDNLTPILIGLIAGLAGIVLVLFVLSKKKRERLLDARRQAEVESIQNDIAGHPVLGGRDPSHPAKVLAWIEMLDADQTRIPISGTSARIGRGKDDEVRIPNDSVSRSHCVLKRTPEGKWLVSDLESGNGVYLNGSRIDQSLLVDGDEIELGEIKMRFRLNQDQEA